LTPRCTGPDDRAVIIDGDGHLVEPPRIWTDYVDPELRAAVRVERDGAGGEWVQLGDTRITLHLPAGPTAGIAFQRASLYSVGDTLNPEGLDEGNPRHRPYSEAAPGGSDPHARLALHAREGIDAAVLFPTMGLFVSGVSDPRLAAGACRAINRFAADYCSAAPHELYAVATLAAQDPGQAALELERAVRAGLVGGCLRPNPTRGGLRIDDPALDVLWARAQDLDVPICFHNALNVDVPQAGLDRVRCFPIGHAVVHPFEQMLAFASLLQSGVFERFPRLRFGFMESSSGWAPFWIDRLEEHWERFAWMVEPRPRRLPAEIFRSQCAVGCETDEPMIPYVQERLGEEQVVWASDYPHFDAHVPGLVKPLVERADLTARQREGVLWRAAVRLYRLDAAAIERAVATRRARG
jgi:predicted TIM-barrel fold metal-dependent hydrolase